MWSAAISKRQHVIGVLAVLAFLLGPVALSGSAHPSEVVFFASVIVAVPSMLSLGLGFGDRRRYSTRATIAIAYALAAAAGAVIAVIWQRVDPYEDANIATDAAKGAYLGMAMVGIWGMFMVMPRAVQAERERADMRREAERSRVRAALEPHFVLNTLNAIASLIGDDPETARALVGDLGDLLRDVVQMSERDVQPASAEIAWLQRYARILEARHAGRLAVEWKIEPAAAAMRIPVLLLQPLVENAIQHGALQGGGHVRVSVEVAGKALRCTVADDGPGMPADVRDGARGLALTRRRLAVDAPGSTLEISSAPTGTRAIVNLVPA